MIFKNVFSHIIFYIYFKAYYCFFLFGIHNYTGKFLQLIPYGASCLASLLLKVPPLGPRAAGPGLILCQHLLLLIILLIILLLLVRTVGSGPWRRPACRLGCVILVNQFVMANCQMGIK